MLKVRVVIVEADGDDATLRAVLDAFVSHSQPNGAIAPATLAPNRSLAASTPSGANGRRGAIAAGSPAARVLEACRAPVSKAALLEQAESIGLKRGTVKALVEQLVASKHLAREGKSRATKYVVR